MRSCHKRWKQNVLIKCSGQQKNKNKQINTNDAFFLFQIRSNANLETKKNCATIIVSPLSNAPHCHTHNTAHRNHIHIQSILNDWWSMLATLMIIIHPTTHTHTHARALILGKRIQKSTFKGAHTQKEREQTRRRDGETENKCEFQRIPHTHIYILIWIQRLDHCSSPYTF